MDICSYHDRVGEIALHTWNLSIKDTAPASSAGRAIDKVVGVLQKQNHHACGKLEPYAVFRDASDV